MLRTRLIVGTLLIAALVGLCWLDHGAAVPGIWLLPVLVAFVALATQELLALLSANAPSPVAWVVYVGNMLVLLSPWGPLAMTMAQGVGIPSQGMPISYGGPALGAGDWVVGALAISVVLAIVAEMARYQQAGRVTTDLAAAVLAITYLGLLLSFAVRLRLDWGIGGLASLVIVVKMGDTGAYFVGKGIGRRPMAPRLSPKKTVEGAIGALVFSALASWAVFQWLVPVTLPPSGRASAALGHVGGSVVFGLLVGAAGMLGDLAESLLKRDAGRKDSSTWIPGLGGALDMLDSVILAAPVAYACWSLGLIG